MADADAIVYNMDARLEQYVDDEHDVRSPPWPGC